MGEASNHRVPGGEPTLVWPRQALWPFLRIGDLVFFATTRKKEVAIHRLRTAHSGASEPSDG